VQREICKARHWRLRDYLAKVGRDCTLFSVRRGPWGLRAVCRDELSALQPLLVDPDRFIADGNTLKAGGSATVSLADVDGRPLVVKRYNIKGPAHWLRRCWRPSRAWHSWREGHRLAFLGIATPRPLAVLERRFGWLRGPAWLISQHLTGEHILTRFAPYVDGAPPAAELAALEELFSALLRERISHGDLKGTNLIWHDGAWALIDLDAMHQHRSRFLFRRAYARDRARFLRNWPVDSALHRLLDQRLPQLPGTCGPQRG
jgi:tRNA A-37 threonylcarbamoyl transferase component Bud32